MNKESNEEIKTPTKKQELIWAIKFVLFSCTAGIIQLLSFTLLNEVFHTFYWPAYLTALILSVLYNFTLNRRFTFKSANNIPIAMLKVFGYYCIFTPVSTILGDYFADTVGVNEYIVLFVTMVLNLLTEFLFCRYVVYRNSINTNDLARKKNDQNSELSMCGFRCDLCKAYAANIKKKDERPELACMWKKYYDLDGFDNNTYCDGCRSKEQNAKRVDNECPVRACVMEKGLEHCGMCPQYPCRTFMEREGLTCKKACDKFGEAFDQTEYDDFLLAYDNKTRLDTFRNTFTK